MKKVIFSIVIVLCCSIAISGCIKQSRNSLTINPTMTATIGAANFTALSVVPSVYTSQVNDTTNVLVITGNANLLQTSPGDQIILTLNKYKNATGTFSLVQGQAAETFIHNGVSYKGVGGILAITSISSNTINGYFSFTTDSVTITNGSFSVGIP